MKKYSFYPLVTALFFLLSPLFAQSLKGMKVPTPPKSIDIKDVEEELDNVFKPEFDTFINTAQFKEAWLGSGMTDDDLVILKKYVKRYDITFSTLYREYYSLPTYVILYGSDEDAHAKDASAEEKQRVENYNLVLKSPLGRLNIEPFFPKTLGLLDKYADTDRYKMYRSYDDVDPYDKSFFIKGFPVFWTDLIPKLPTYAKKLK